MYSSGDYVAVPVGDAPAGKRVGRISSFSPLRTWKRATKCQKNLAYLLLLLVIISIILYSNQLQEMEEEEVGIANEWRQKRREVKQNANRAVDNENDGGNHIKLPQLDDTKKKAIKDLENKIQKDLDVQLPGPLDIPDPKDEQANAVKPSPLHSHNERQEFITNMMKHAWKAYKKDAWGEDHLHPISHGHDNWFHVGLTLLDSLDTLYLMGLKTEYDEARDWVAKELSFDINVDVNLFECTIRVLGSMLSMYHLTHDRMYLDKAVDIGNRLLPALTKSPSAVPFSDVNLKTGAVHPPKWGPDSTVSEVTSIQLEFRDLSFLTGDSKYKEAVDKVSLHVHNLPGKKDGLVPMWINARHGNFRAGSTLTVGARADSYYEYLLKLWIQTGQTEDMYRDDYLAAVKGIQKHLVGQSVPNGLTYVGELLGGVTPSAKMDHLVCFLGGSLALGSTLFRASNPTLADEHLELGKNITSTCHEMYVRTPTGLSPEITYFNLNRGNREDVIIKPLDRHNLLRPETVEAFFYLWRVTGDERYRTWGWDIAQAFEKYSKVETGGYTSLKNVMDPAHTLPMDKMESFFLGETLKYLFLLFSDDRSLLPLDKWVLNTEGHPFPVQSSNSAA